MKKNSTGIGRVWNTFWLWKRSQAEPREKTKKDLTTKEHSGRKYQRITPRARLEIPTDWTWVYAE